MLLLIMVGLLKLYKIAPFGFEPKSKDPESPMIDRYTTGLFRRPKYSINRYNVFAHVQHILHLRLRPDTMACMIAWSVNTDN